MVSDDFIDEVEKAEKDIKSTKIVSFDLLFD